MLNLLPKYHIVTYQYTQHARWIERYRLWFVWSRRLIRISAGTSASAKIFV